MKILITGGSGFIGSHLSTLLKNQKHQLTIYDLNPPQDSDLNFVSGDILDSKKIIEYSKKTDLVFLSVKLKNNIPMLISGEPVESVLTELKTCALSISAQKMELDAEPEEGKVKEMAHLYDQFQLAEKKAELAEKYAVRIAEEAKEKQKVLESSKDNNLFNMQQEISEVLEIREKAIHAKKRVFREKEKLKKVENEAKSEGILTKE